MKTQEKNYKNQITEDKTELIANNNFWKGEQQRVGDENKIKKFDKQTREENLEWDKRDENIYTEWKNFSLWHNKKRKERKICEFLREFCVWRGM